MNAQTTQGNTPLMYAASNCGPGSDEIVRLLLDNGMLSTCEKFLITNLFHCVQEQTYQTATRMAIHRSWKQHRQGMLPLPKSWSNPEPVLIPTRTSSRNLR